jgi:di/tricarboxylate transporter
MKNELIALLLTLGIGYTIYKVNKDEYVMEKTAVKSKKKNIKRELKTDPRTGMPILTGSPAFTKKDVAKDFPEDSDRDSVIIRRSVGL